MTRSEDLSTYVDRLLAQALRIVELDERRCEFADQFDAAVAAARADHARGQSSDEIAKLAQLVEVLGVIDRVALEELERAAATLSEVTALGTR